MALTGTKALMVWCQQVTNGYKDVEIKNMTSSWRNGLAFCAILHHYRPDLINFDKLSKENIAENNHLAFTVAENELDIAALLDVEDMVEMEVPDKLSILTYVSQYYNYFKDKVPGEIPPPSRHPSKRHAAFAPNDVPKKKTAVPGVSAAKEVIGATPVPKMNKSTIDRFCARCRETVYLMERLQVEGKLFHRVCFKCFTCDAQLRMGTYRYIPTEDQFYCDKHYRKRTTSTSSDEQRSPQRSHQNEQDALQSLLKSLENKRKANEVSQELPEPAALHTRVENARKKFQQAEKMDTDNDTAHKSENAKQNNTGTEPVQKAPNRPSTPPILRLLKDTDKQEKSFLPNVLKKSTELKSANTKSTEYIPARPVNPPVNKLHSSSDDISQKEGDKKEKAKATSPSRPANLPGQKKHIADESSHLANKGDARHFLSNVLQKKHGPSDHLPHSGLVNNAEKGGTHIYEAPFKIVPEEHKDDNKNEFDNPRYGQQLGIKPQAIYQNEGSSLLTLERNDLVNDKKNLITEHEMEDDHGRPKSDSVLSSSSEGGKKKKLVLKVKKKKKTEDEKHSDEGRNSVCKDEGAEEAVESGIGKGGKEPSIMSAYDIGINEDGKTDIMNHHLKKEVDSFGNAQKRLEEASVTATTSDVENEEEFDQSTDRLERQEFDENRQKEEEMLEDDTTNGKDNEKEKENEVVAEYNETSSKEENETEEILRADDETKKEEMNKEGDEKKNNEIDRIQVKALSEEIERYEHEAKNEEGMNVKQAEEAIKSENEQEKEGVQIDKNKAIEEELFAMDFSAEDDEGKGGNKAEPKNEEVRTNEVDDSITNESKTVKYINPFEDTDDEMLDDHDEKSKVSLNPFESSDNDDDNDDEVAIQSTDQVTANESQSHMANPIRVRPGTGPKLQVSSQKVREHEKKIQDLKKTMVENKIKQKQYKNPFEDSDDDILDEKKGNEELSHETDNKHHKKLVLKVKKQKRRAPQPCPERNDALIEAKNESDDKKSKPDKALDNEALADDRLEIFKDYVENSVIELDENKRLDERPPELKLENINKNEQQTQSGMKSPVSASCPSLTKTKSNIQDNFNENKPSSLDDVNEDVRNTTPDRMYTKDIGYVPREKLSDNGINNDKDKNLLLQKVHKISDYSKENVTKKKEIPPKRPAPPIPKGVEPYKEPPSATPVFVETEKPVNQKENKKNGVIKENKKPKEKVLKTKKKKNKSPKTKKKNESKIENVEERKEEEKQEIYFIDEKELTQDEISIELKSIETRQRELEQKGVKMEKKLREQLHGEPEENYMITWFDLVTEKNKLLRRENELIYMSQEIEYHNNQKRIEYELRLLMEKDESMKTEEDRQAEEQLLAQLVNYVSRRNKIVEKMEEDRLREREEDEQIQMVMKLQGLSKHKKKKAGKKNSSSATFYD